MRRVAPPSIALVLSLPLALFLHGCGGEERVDESTPAVEDASGTGGSSDTDAAPGERPDDAARDAGLVLDAAPIEPSVTRPVGARRPDVLMISIDTLRADRLGCYGHWRDTSPTIDGLAARGVRFDDVYAPDSATAQCHATMFTGLLPAAHGVHNAKGASSQAIHRDVPTIVEVLAAAGYGTCVITEGGQLQPGMGFDRGADEAAFLSKGMERSSRVFARAIGAFDDDTPLFAFYHTYQVHAPYLPPLEPVDGIAFHGRFAPRGKGGVFEERYLAVSAGDATSTMAGRSFIECRPQDRPQVPWLSALYDEGIAYMDHLLADLLRDWDEQRSLENTLIVITSDHGESLGENERIGHGNNMLPSATRVPLILAGPGVEPGVVEGAIGLRSVPGTIVEHLGLARPATMDVSYAPFLSAAGRGGEHEVELGTTVYQQYVKDRLRVATVRGDVHTHWLHGEVGGNALATWRSAGTDDLQVLRGDRFLPPGRRIDDAALEVHRAGLDRLAIDLALGALVPASVHELGADVRRQLQDLGYADDASGN